MLEVMAGEFEKQPEIAGMLQQLFLMQEQGLDESCRILVRMASS